MQTENNSPKQPVSYYGKKVYYINPLFAQKEKPEPEKPKYSYEDVRDDYS